MFLTTRGQIARKEAEVAKIVDQARRNSDRRLLVAGSKLVAENELEQALIERTVRDNIRLSRMQARSTSTLYIISVHIVLLLVARRGSVRGKPRLTVVIRGACHGKPWQTVAGRGQPWQAVASRGKPWQAVASRGKPWQAVATLRCAHCTFRGLVMARHGSTKARGPCAPPPYVHPSEHDASWRSD